MEEMFSYVDQLGPEKIIHVYQPDLDLKAVLVVDNTAAGPSLGGMRMAVRSASYVHRPIQSHLDISFW